MPSSSKNQHFDEIDIKMMKQALQLAKLAKNKDEVPVGAVLVDKSGIILAQTHNLRETLQSPLAHAEMSALHKSAQSLKSWRLVDCTLYVTLEPCFMCAGALVQSRIKRVVFGALDPKGGAMVSLAHIGSDPRLNHTIQVEHGLLSDECGQILKDFFRKKRQSKK